jgi:N-acetylmuramoyl-L-alanine amidase
VLTSLIHEARYWPTLWRRRLIWHWHVSAKDYLPFAGMLALPLIGVASIIYFAYANSTRTDPVQIQVVQAEVKRANRRESDLQCLAENVYYEARGEPLNGQYAVAEVTLNRMRAEHFPHTLCAVVHEMRWDSGRHRYVADFSWTELGGLSPDDVPSWKRALEVATAAYDDTHDPIVPGALFYHSTSVRPGWARGRTAIATIGNHVFYR